MRQALQVQIDNKKLETRQRKRSLFRNRDFTRLFIGYGVSSLGDQLYFVGIPLLVFELLHSAIKSGMTTALEFLPTAAAGLWIGVLFDRFSRKKLMILGLLVQAALVILLAMLLESHRSTFGIIGILVVFISMMSLVVLTGYETVLPSIVESDQMVDASSAVQYLFTSVRMAGPAIAGVILSVFGYVGAFWLDGLSFILYAWQLSRIRFASPPRPRTPAKQDFYEGIRFVFQDPVLKPLILGFLAANVGFGTAVPMYVVTMKSGYHLTANAVGWVFTLGSIGGLCGNFLYQRLNKRMKIGNQMIWTGAIILLGFLAMWFLHSSFMFGIGFVLIQMGSFWANGNFFFVTQRRTPERLRGRTTSITRTLTRMTGPLMALTGGILTDLFGAFAVYAVAAGCMVISMTVSYIGGLWELKAIHPASVQEDASLSL